MSLQIDLKLLRILEALSATGSLQAAAQRLYVTQSALSHQLRDVEQQLGSQLFIRKSQPVQFSEQGQLLLELARQVLPAIRNTEQLLQSGSAMQWRLTVECHACFHWLLPAIKAVRAQLPSLQLSLATEIEYHAIEAMLSGELDLVLTTDDRLHQQVVYQPLFELELLAYLPPEHPLAQQDWLTPADLANQSLLTYPVPATRQDLFRYFLPPKTFTGRQRQVAQASQLVQLVAAGEGIAVLPGWLAEPYLSQGLLVTRRLGQTGLRRMTYLGCRQQDAQKLPVQLPKILQQFAPVSH